MKKSTVRPVDHADAADLKHKFGLVGDRGVRKYRTFEEARRALWLPKGDPEIVRRMKRLAELAAVTPVERGVRRFRSIEEAKASK